MACGTVPITSSTSGSTSFIKDNENGWIIDYTSVEHTTKILKEAIACVSTPKFKIMQENARKIIANEFSIEIMVKKYLDLWDSFAGRPRKTTQETPSWMNFVLAALFFKNNPPQFLNYLLLYFEDNRHLDRYFIQHPLGIATISFYFQNICPALLTLNKNNYVKIIYYKLRLSKCYSPLLTELERRAQNDK